MSEKTAADVVAEAINEIKSQLEPLHAALAILNGRATVSGNVSVRLVAATPTDPSQTEVTVHVPVNGNGSASEATVAPSRRNTSRSATAQILAQFDRRQVRTLEEAAGAAKVSTRQIALGVLIRHGYLKRKGDGLIRTAKVFKP